MADTKWATVSTNEEFLNDDGVNPLVYEHNIVAFCIAVIFIYYFSNKKPTRIVKTVSNISFEIYLYHCMFGVGPIKISDLTRFYSLNCVIIILLSAVIAYIMNKFSDMVLKKI